MSWFIVLLLILLSALFSSAETAFTALDAVHLQKYAAGSRRVRAIMAVLANPQPFLTTVLVGNNIVNIAAASVTTALAIRTWGEQGAWWATIGLTCVVLLFAEILPKSIATVVPRLVASLLLPLVRLAEWLLWPVIILFSGIARVLFWMLRLPQRRPVWVPSLDEIQHLVERSEKGGILDKDRGEMIDALLGLDDVPARSVMIPRRQVRRIGLDWPVERVERELALSGFTRYPVYSGGVDEVSGLLLAKEYYRWRIDHPEGGSWRALIRPLSFHLDESPVLDVLRQMRLQGEHLVGIVDEYGEFEGILTIEDILEEIFYPESTTRRLPIKRRLGGEVEVPGDLSLRDLARALDLDADDEDAETVGGWVSGLGARYSGERCSTPDGKWEIEVLSGDERGVSRVRLVPTESAGKEAGDEMEDESTGP